MAFDPTTFRQPIHRRFYDYWREKAGTRSCPARRDLDPVEFAWALGWVTLLEALPNGDWLFRVDGSLTAEYFGGDMTGKRRSEYGNPGLREFLMATSARGARLAEPVLVHRDTEIALKRWQYDGLLLPLSDDGIKVDRLLSIMAIWPEAARSTSAPGERPARR